VHRRRRRAAFTSIRRHQQLAIVSRRSPRKAAPAPDPRHRNRHYLSRVTRYDALVPIDARLIQRGRCRHPRRRSSARVDARHRRLHSDLGIASPRSSGWFRPAARHVHPDGHNRASIDPRSSRATRLADRSRQGVPRRVQPAAPGPTCVRSPVRQPDLTSEHATHMGSATSGSRTGCGRSTARSTTRAAATIVVFTQEIRMNDDGTFSTRLLNEGRRDSYGLEM